LSKLKGGADNKAICLRYFQGVTLDEAMAKLVPQKGKLNLMIPIWMKSVPYY
jgi:hypothetical protein